MLSHADIGIRLVGIKEINENQISKELATLPDIKLLFSDSALMKYSH